MISPNTLKRFCCEDISLIENYDKAINDNTQIWHCHHRFETDKQLSRQDLIDADLYYNRPAKELIFLTSKEHRLLHSKYGKPFIRTSYWKDKKLPEDMCKKISIAKQGIPRTTPIWNKGIHTNYSEEVKREAAKKAKETRSKWSDEYKREIYNKLSEANKGNTFAKNRIHIHKGEISKMIYEYELEKYLNDGFELGRPISVVNKVKKSRTGIHYKLKTPRSKEYNKKISESKRGDKNPVYGKIWINNGIEAKMIYKEELDYYISIGYIKGRIKYKTKHKSLNTK